MHNTSCYNHCQISPYNTITILFITNAYIWKAYAWTYMHSHLFADSGHYDLFKEFKTCMIWSRCLCSNSSIYIHALLCKNLCITGIIYSYNKALSIWNLDFVKWILVLWQNILIMNVFPLVWTSFYYYVEIS